MEQYQLVIAEKPSVAQALAAVLGAKKKQDGYLEGNGWLVSWCVGHLVELAQPGAYDEKYAKWRYDDLPILPASWKYQVTLDYLQSLYEKKLATYPRTDSQYITADMQATVGSLALWLWQNMPFAGDGNAAPELERIINDSKVTDHHAILPTAEIAYTDLSALPAGEKDVLMLLAARLLCATGQPYCFEAVTATLEAETYRFKKKEKTVLLDGWKEIERAFRSGLKQTAKPEDESEDTARLPELREGQRFANISASVREGKTNPPKHYTEDSLLAAMETAGVDEMPDDAERKGLGTSATRAATLEKLVSTGFLQRKKKQLIPSDKGVHLIAVLPEGIKSPSLTAEWESMLKQVE